MKAEDAETKKLRIMQDYDATASFYDDRYKQIQFEKFKRIFLRTRTLNSPILDFGGGTGLFLEYLFESNKLIYSYATPLTGNHYVNIDISMEMLKAMNSKVIIDNLSEEIQVHAVCADCENPPFRDNIFNSFISLTSFQNFPNPKKALIELHRITTDKAEGFVTILNKKITKNEWVDLISSVFKNARIISGDFIEDLASHLKK